jgi:hypothetical protein
MAFDKNLPANGTLGDSAQMRAQLVALSRKSGPNLFADPTMLIWGAGDAAAPSHYVLTGTGASIARVGTGHATDTKQKEGPYSAKVVAGAATAELMQGMVPTAVFASYALASTYFGLGAWAYSSVGASARLKIDDGSAPLYSSYHTGSSTWEWLSVAGQIGAGATKLSMGANVASGGTAWFSGFTAGQGDVPPERFTLPRTVLGDLNFSYNGIVDVSTNRGRKLFQRPALVKNCALDLETANTGAALIVDVEKWDGSSWLSLFQSSGVRPQVAAAASPANGQAQPNNTAFADYSRRCFSGYAMTGSRANSRLRYSVTQVGSSVKGSDLTVGIMVEQFQFAFEHLLPYNGA